MPPNSKRRIDYRVIRVTATYSVKQLARELNRTVDTVHSWIEQGLPTIDDLSPAMVYGWAAKDWIREKWDARRSHVGPHQIYCFKCAEPHEPQTGSLTIERRGRSLVAAGTCSACGTIAYRAVTPETARELTERFGTKKGEANRF